MSGWCGCKEFQQLPSSKVPWSMALTSLSPDVPIKNLAAKREHDLLMREKSILCQLADKGNFNLIGTSGDKLVNAMLQGTFDEGSC
jgi:hypothetical protein